MAYTFDSIDTGSDGKASSCNYPEDGCPGRDKRLEEYYSGKYTSWKERL